MLTSPFFEFLGPLGDQPCTHSLHHCFCLCLLSPLPYNFAVDAATYTAGGLSAVGALFIISCIWAYDRQPKLFTKLVLVLSCVDFLVRVPGSTTRSPIKAVLSMPNHSRCISSGKGWGRIAH
jgi:hypothetical protein